MDVFGSALPAGSWSGRFWRAAAVLAAAAGWVVGCQPDQAPRAPADAWLPVAVAVQRAIADESAVARVQADCRIRLTDADGHSVRLEGALVLQRPDRLRLEAWKLGQPAMALLRTPDRLQWSSRQNDKHDDNQGGQQDDQQDAEAQSPEGLARMVNALLAGWWPDGGRAVLAGALFSEGASSEGASVAEAGGMQATGEGFAVLHDGLRTWGVDRQTGRLVMAEVRGQYAAQLTWPKRSPAGDPDWPSQITLTAGGTQVRVRFTRVSVNGSIDPGAWAPLKGTHVHTVPAAGAGDGAGAGGGAGLRLEGAR